MNETRPQDVEARRLQEAGHWLVRLREGTPTDPEMAAWIEWCETDPQNLAAFEELEALWSAAGQHPPPRRQQSFSAWRPLRAALAASVIVAVIGGGLFWATRSTRPRVVATEEVLHTSVARNENAMLPDGSRVVVGGRTVMDVNFAGAERELELRSGEAFFDVKHDADRPFVVKAGALRIVAVGTAFDVRRTGEQVSVTVRAGVVELRRESAPEFTPVRATADQQLVVDEHTGAVRLARVDPAAALAWQSGRLEFTGDPLSVVVANVNRYSTRSIVLEDPELGDLTFTGTVFFNDVDTWLDGLREVFPIAVRRVEPDEILLVRRDHSH